MSEEEKYEHVDILIKSPAEGSWFDRLFDFITSFCDGTDEEGTCTCGMESMGGSSGTIEQCYDHMRLTEKWAFDVRTDDLKLALHRLSADVGMDDEVYKRLRDAAYWHDDFDEWVANIPDDEEEFELDPEVAPYFSDEPLPTPVLSHLEHYQTCNCLADSGTCCREGCWCWDDE